MAVTSTLSSRSSFATASSCLLMHKQIDTKNEISSRSTISQKQILLHITWNVCPSFRLFQYSREWAASKGVKARAKMRKRASKNEGDEERRRMEETAAEEEGKQK